MGGGAIFFDADQDGDEDLYLNGGLNRDELYLNDGTGVFTKANTNNGLEVTLQYNTTASISGDIDNDGDRDIFVSTWEANSTSNVARNLLFENNGDGTFTEVGATSGITHTAFTIGANFVDYNRDSYLDIHVINHIETPAFLYDSTGVIVGFDHDCFDNFFYRNNGDGTFTEIASQLGTNDSGCALAALASDYDMDGDSDIFIANDFGPFIVPNSLYQNDYPADTYTDVSTATGADIPMYGMGIAAGDYDQDLDLDYYITNLGANVLLENEGGSFTDVAASAQVENTFANDFMEFATGWGTAFFDIDNDSWLDLFVSNGRIPSLSTLPTAMNDPNKLYLNNGDKTFSDISDQNNVGDPSYSRGMAYADIDKDGDLDFVVINQDELGGKTKFYRNDSDGQNHFVQFKLVGKESNRDAYGAMLWLHAGGKTFLREIDGGGGSFCSQSTSIVHFGLGDIDQIDSLRINWPNGHVDHLGTYAIDEQHIIEEGIISSSSNDLEEAKHFTISPNPMSGRQLLISTDEVVDQAFDLTLFSLTGRVLFQQEMRLQSGQTTVALPSDLAAGYYSLRLQSDSQRQVFKLIVN